jgi:IclR family pca regulon transcriptional regulator
MSTEDKDTQKRPDEIQTLVKGFAVIKAFSAAHPKLTLSEVAHITGLTRAGARRVLLTLRSLGYVTSDRRYFRLEPRILELGYAYLSSQPWWRFAQAAVERLAEKIDHPASVGVVDQEWVTYVAHALPPRLEIFPRSTGTRIPVGPSAMGRILLASLPDDELNARLKSLKLSKLTKFTVTSVTELRAAIMEARKLGYALIDQELEMGLRSLAIPIRDRSGRVMAAVGFSSSDLPFKKDAFVKKYLSALRSTSAEISSHLAS